MLGLNVFLTHALQGLPLNRTFHLSVGLAEGQLINKSISPPLIEGIRLSSALFSIKKWCRLRTVSTLYKQVFYIGIHVSLSKYV